jgi:hypothetical protein
MTAEVALMESPRLPFLKSESVCFTVAINACRDAHDNMKRGFSQAAEERVLVELGLRIPVINARFRCTFATSFGLIPGVGFIGFCTTSAQLNNRLGLCLMHCVPLAKF